MGSLLRATTLLGYGDLVRELGGDPSCSCRASGFRRASKIRRTRSSPSMRTCACWRPAPTTWVVRTSDFVCRTGRACIPSGPIAVIARNAQTVLGGFEAIARYLYVHSPALKLTLAPRAPRRRVSHSPYEVTEPGTSRDLQAYEISMAIAVRIIRLLGGPEARPDRDLVHARATGLRRGVQRSAGLPGAFPADMVRIRATPPPGRQTHRERGSGDADASPRNILSPITFRAPRRCPNAWQSWPAGCCPPANAASRPSPTNSRCTHGRCNDAGHGGRAMPGPHRTGTPRPGGEIPRRTGAASQPDRGPPWLRRTEHPQPLVPTLVREDTSPVPGRPGGDCLVHSPSRSPRPGERHRSRIRPQDRR